jgi:hypothetical protein
MNKLRKRPALASLLLIIFAPLGQAQDSPPLAIVHAVIIDGNGNAPIEDGTIIIQGDKIISVGPSAGIKIPRNARIIEARGKAVMPGIADMHVHLTGGWDGISTDILGYQRYMNSLRVIIDQGSRNGSMDLMREGVSAFAHLPTIQMSDEAVALMKEKSISCLSTLSVFESFSRRRLADLSFLSKPSMPPPRTPRS